MTADTVGVRGEKGSLKPEPEDLLVALTPLILSALGCFVPPKIPMWKPKPSEPQRVTDLEVRPLKMWLS